MTNYPTGYAVLRGELVRVLALTGRGSEALAEVRAVPLAEGDWLAALDTREVDPSDLDGVRDRDDLLTLAYLHGWPLEAVRGLSVPAGEAP